MQELYPNNSEAYWILGLIDYTRKDYPRRYLLPGCRPPSDEETWSEMHLVWHWRRQGQRTEAGQLLKKLEASPEVKEAAHVEMAPVYWNLGPKAGCSGLAGALLQWHANWMISLRMDPIWAEMRGSTVRAAGGEDGVSVGEGHFSISFRFFLFP